MKGVTLTILGAVGLISAAVASEYDLTVDTTRFSAEQIDYLLRTNSHIRSLSLYNEGIARAPEAIYELPRLRALALNRTGFADDISYCDIASLDTLVIIEYGVDFDSIRTSLQACSKHGLFFQYNQ
jgi:hypothetical protein